MGYGYGGYGGYGMMGMGVIQTPSFNYTTTIVQSPPIIVNNPVETVYPPLPRSERQPSGPGNYQNKGR